MIIITYSETNAQSIEQRIGKAEYSYYFIYRGYIEALKKLGRHIDVTDPLTEVDRIYRENPDEECIFFSFSPPHKTILDLECPTVCVFAWEFSTIPYESWHGVEEHNWARNLEIVGNALTISEYAAEVVRKTLPGKLHLAAIPTAVKTRDSAPEMAGTGNTQIPVKATLYDSREYTLAADAVNDTVNSTRDPFEMVPWDEKPVSLAFTQDNPDTTRLLIGFYSAEDWGTWSRTKTPWILLPHLVKGPVVIELELVGYGANIGRELQLSLGEEQATITPGSLPEAFELRFNPTEECDVLKFHNIELEHAPGARDHRSLGVGVKAMKLKRPDNYVVPVGTVVANFVNRITASVREKLGWVPEEKGSILELDGVVYTTVMNPQDGRKNWEDMVTAFCWAFRNEPNATLVLKMTHHNLATFLGKLLLLYSQMSPFKCRVVAVHGFLSEQQYQALIDRTHYVVNSSHCEGQCLPLMEYMGQGIPALAPDHTAMAEYVNEDNAFIVGSSLYPTFWPMDDRKAIRTLCYRIDWNSLKDAYLDSYRVVREDAARYRSMCDKSIEAIESAAGEKVVFDKLRDYIASTAKRSSGDQ